MGHAAQLAAAVLAVGLMTGCGPEDTASAGAGTGSGSSSSESASPGGTQPDGAKDSGGSGKPDGKEPAASPKGPAGKPPKKPAGKEPAGALTCAQLQNAQLQNDTTRLPDHPPGASGLTDGRWSGGGITIELLPQCAIGDLTGDSAADALGVVRVDGGGTGRFYSLVVWRNDGGTPVLAATAGLGDRTPVQSVAITSATRQAQVVYLTRGDDEPSAIVSIRRDAVYHVSGTDLVELSHSDAPYTP